MVQMTVRAGWRLVLILVCLGIAALLAAAGLVIWMGTNTGTKVLGEGAFSPPVLSSDKSLGVNADLAQLDRSEREAALTAMEAAGLQWLRHRFPWDVGEPKPGGFEWEEWDEIVETSTRHNLKLIAVLDGSPEWTRAGENADNPLAPPVESRAFGDWAAAFAERYGQWIDHYQIWDEPNIAPHWGAGEIDPGSYAHLLREGAIRIRTADPGAVILAAALAPNVEPGGTNMSELVFLDSLYRLGADEWFDVVAGQPYDFGERVDAAPAPERLNWRRLELLHGVMQSHGDRQGAVWATSFGQTAMDPGAVVEMVEQSRRDWPWLGPALWAAWSPGDQHDQYALLGSDGQPGQVYETLGSLGSLRTVAWPGVYGADHPSGTYRGAWRVTPLGADIGASGNRLTIPFMGTRLDLGVRRGDYRAFLFVSVDGEPANALPRDSEEQAYVVLYDPDGRPDVVTVARGLEDGKHVAEIVADRGWGQWAVLGWAVARQSSRRGPMLPIALGFGAIVFLGISLGMAWSSRGLLLRTCTTFVSRYRTLDTRLVLPLTGAVAILVYVMAGSVPTLVALGLLALLLLLRPETGLPLIAVALPFYQLGRPLLGKVFSMIEILVLLTAMGWLLGWLLELVVWLQSARNQKPPGFGASWHPTGLDLGVLALLALGACSLLWAEHQRVALREFRTVILEAVIFYALLRAMVRKEREAWLVADAWVLGGALIALIGVVQWVAGQNLITADDIWRVRGFYGSPNNLALYLGRVFPLTVAVAAFAGFDTRASQGTWWNSRRFGYGVAALFMVAALLLTYSRGAWLVGVPASLLFLAAMRGRRAFAVAAGVVFIAAVAMLLGAGGGRLASLVDPSTGTTFFRLQLWQSSVAMVGDRPLLGVGLDNFLYQYRSHYVMPTAWEEFNLSHPHNLVLDFWLRLGLLGVGILAWLLVGFFRQGWNAYRRLPEGWDRLLVLGLLAGMVNFVAHGLVDNAFFLVDLAFVFVLMLALVQIPRQVTRLPASVPGS
jgi:O-antigen ligase